MNRFNALLLQLSIFFCSCIFLYVIHEQFENLYTIIFCKMRNNWCYKTVEKKIPLGVVTVSLSNNFEAKILVGAWKICIWIGKMLKTAIRFNFVVIILINVAASVWLSRLILCSIFFGDLSYLIYFNIDRMVAKPRTSRKSRRYPWWNYKSCPKRTR